PRGVGLDVDRSLLGLDRGKGIGRGEVGRLLHQPLRKDGLGRVGRDAGHPEHARHGQYLAISARAAATSASFAIAALSSTLLMLGDASPPVTRQTGPSRRSKKRRWISSASHPPYDVPRAPCSATRILLVLVRLASIVSQSMLARSSQRRSMTSASTSFWVSTALSTNGVMAR